MARPRTTPVTKRAKVDGDTSSPTTPTARAESSKAPTAEDASAETASPLPDALSLCAIPEEEAEPIAVEDDPREFPAPEGDSLHDPH